MNIAIDFNWIFFVSEILPSSPVTCHFSQVMLLNMNREKKLTSDSGCLKEVPLDFRLQVNAIDSKDPNPTFCLLLFCWN